MKNGKLSTIATIILVTSIFFNGATAQETAEVENHTATNTATSPNRNQPNLISEDEQAKRNAFRASAHKNGLSPAQIDTIDQLQDELPRAEYAEHIVAHGECEAIDYSVLVGKNIVFHWNWLRYVVGPDAQTTPQSFAKLRDNLDNAYDSYADLTGTTPQKGEKVLIYVVTLPNASVRAHAHSNENVICFNSNPKTNGHFWKEVDNGSWSYVLLHELAHIFTQSYEYHIGHEASESMANFMISHVLEKNKDAHYGLPELNCLCGLLTSGTEHRKRIIENAKNSNVAFSGKSNRDDVFAFYLQGLVEKVGWDNVKKAFRSYSDDEYQPRFNFLGGDQEVAAFGFFERMMHNTPKKDIMSSFPDNGQMLELFNVTVTPRATSKTTEEEKQSHSAPKDGGADHFRGNDEM